jgi:hypothetical protein
VNGSRETLGAMTVLTCIAAEGAVAKLSPPLWVIVVSLVLLGSLAAGALIWAFLTPGLDVLRQTHRFEWVLGLSMVAFVLAFVFLLTGVWGSMLMALVAMHAGAGGLFWLGGAEDRALARKLRAHRTVSGLL